MSIDAVGRGMGRREGAFASSARSGGNGDCMIAIRKIPMNPKNAKQLRDATHYTRFSDFYEQDLWEEIDEVGNLAAWLVEFGVGDEFAMAYHRIDNADYR